MRYHLNLQMIDIIGKVRVRPIFKGENKNLDIPRVGMSKIEKKEIKVLCLILANFYGIWDQDKKQHNQECIIIKLLGGSKRQRFDEFFPSIKLETKVRGVGWHIIDWWWASIESQLTELCSCEFRKVIFISTNVSVSRTGTRTRKASSTSGGRSLQFLVVVVTQHHVGLFEENHVSLDKTRPSKACPKTASVWD